MYTAMTWTLFQATFNTEIKRKRRLIVSLVVQRLTIKILTFLRASFSLGIRRTWAQKIVVKWWHCKTIDILDLSLKPLRDAEIRCPKKRFLRNRYFVRIKDIRVTWIRGDLVSHIPKRPRTFLAPLVIKTQVSWVAANRSNIWGTKHPWWATCPLTSNWSKNHRQF